MGDMTTRFFISHEPMFIGVLSRLLILSHSLYCYFFLLESLELYFSE